jgi:hypothetical protein
VGQFSKNSRTFYPKNLLLSSKKYRVGIRDPGKKNIFRILDPVHGSKRHRIRIRNTGRQEELAEEISLETEEGRREQSERSSQEKEERR